MLEGHAVVAVEVQVVHRLQQHVAELRVADARLETPFHRVTAEHPVDREVLADVAEEVDGREAGRPVVVVDHGGGVRAVELQERLDLAAYPRDPVLDRVEGVQGALAGVLGVADHPGRAADQGVRRVAGPLEPAGGEDLDQVAHVQARGRRVEADIEPDAPAAQRVAQGVTIRGEREQAAPLQVVEEVRVDSHALQPAVWVNRVPTRISSLAGGPEGSPWRSLAGTRSTVRSGAAAWARSGSGPTRCSAGRWRSSGWVWLPASEHARPRAGRA